jgi:ATP-dependent DNA helicase RecG
MEVAMIVKEISKGESKILEFKEKLPKNSSIAKTVVAFSNTSGGKIIIGVNDHREIIGVDERKIFDLKDKIASIIYDHCTPNIIPEIYTVNISDKLLLVIKIFRGNLKPYYLKSGGKTNGVYIRVGATNRKADHLTIKNLEREAKNISFDEEINYEQKYETLDLSELKKDYLDLGKRLTHEKMLNLKLIKKINGIIYPTNALMIILGRYEHSCVKCARFKGKTMEVFLDKKEYSGYLFNQIEKVEKFIKNHLMLASKFNNLQREDYYEIPFGAIREAIINAYVHRDYSNFGRDIKIGIYDDILNIVSPGGYPNTLRQEDIDEGRSEVRNKVLARVFKDLNYIEQWGSGISRIKNMCARAGLKEPQILEKGDYVDVEIYRNINTEAENKSAGLADESAGLADKSAGLAGESSDLKNKKLEEQYSIIKKYLNENDRIQTSEAKEILNLQVRRSREVLKALVELGFLIKKGKGRGTYYTLNKQ